MTTCDCRALGFRLRAIETGDSQRAVIPFEVSDWQLDGEWWFLTIAASVHNKGTSATMHVEMAAGSNWERVLVEEERAPNGTMTLRVVSTPDGRFQGRATFM